MQPEDMILASVDGHLAEPPNLFGGKTPRVIRQADASEAWTLNGALGSMSAKLDV